MPFDLEFWKRWEGRSIDARYLLERCVGEGRRGGALFSTECGGRPARIEIVPGKPEAIQSMRGAWQRIAALSHPALLRVLASGETALDSLRCAYVVVEEAEENLADVLAERFLTAGEAREMLGPLIDGLRYLHAHGFAHGGLHPSNIMAAGDQLKLATEGIVAGGDAAGDCAAIGLLLQEVLGVHQAAQLPAPFAAIAAHCLEADPAARWNLAQIEAALRQGTPESAAAPQPSKAIWWTAAAGAVAVVLALLALWPSSSTASRGSSPPAPKPVDATPPAAPIDTPPPPPPPAANQKKSSKPGPATGGFADKPSPIPLSTPPSAGAPNKPAPAKPRPAAVAAEPVPAQLDGVNRVMPDIPRMALNTISGRVRINARVRVDGAGNVSEASLDPPAASKYFSARVLSAARSWRFPAGDEGRTFLLNFELTRDQVRVLSASELRTRP